MLGGINVKVTRNVMPIADLYNEMEDSKLTINKTYQRSHGLWPDNSRAFFIDTILNEFTFPKITIRQKIDIKTKKAVKEVVDGQQRLTTIRDFINNKFALTSVSKRYKGYKFEHLDQNEQDSFLAYEVSIDAVVSGNDDEVLELFRRINSYTLPLNAPEKRHAEFQGEFKWFILDLVGKYSPMLESNKILTLRGISRMEDADLFTELSEVVLKGIINRSVASLYKLYKENDKIMDNKEETKDRIESALDYIKVDFEEICSSGILNNYLFYSLFAALIYNKYGIKNVKERDVGGCATIGHFTTDSSSAKVNVLRLLDAFEQKDAAGMYGEFVKACSSSTHRVGNRIVRLKWFVRALQDQLE